MRFKSGSYIYLPLSALRERGFPIPQGSAYQTGTGSTQLFELFCIKFIAIIYT